MMTGSNRAFEDFTPGDSAVFHRVGVSREDILAFAAEWDPQPMHLDEEAGRAGMLGGLTGSGWHTVCLLMRGMCEGLLIDSTSSGSPGVDELRWLKPLRPGDELTMRYTVKSARPSKSRPGIGIVHFRFEVANQDGDAVMVMENPILFGRRQAAEAAS